jgi:uncharacterized protein Yka (UPF0111/DUF47 family)
MTEPTSPTNLNADLESSVEQTNNAMNSSEANSELPSSIRQDETNSFSPNLENFNSPPAPQTEEVEDATTRLIRIRDELAHQLRERENEAIQKEIDELENSLDRRHRRGSDHYADLVMAYAIYKPIYASLPIYAYYLSAIVD